MTAVVDPRSILQNEHIRRAIVNYQNALKRRSEHMRAELVYGEELLPYAEKLVDEWERHILAAEDEAGG